MRKRVTNDFDLESKLKSVPVPERSDDYWEDFPSQVRRQLRRSRTESVTRESWLPRLAWAMGCALALVLVFACAQVHPLKTVSFAINTQQMHFHHQLARLDAGLHVLMQDQHGMSYLVAEKN
jgi:hypothetical protein